MKPKPEDAEIILKLCDRLWPQAGIVLRGKFPEFNDWKKEVLPAPKIVEMSREKTPETPSKD